MPFPGWAPFEGADAADLDEQERDVGELQGSRGDYERHRRALHPPRERGRHDQCRHQREQRAETLALGADVFFEKPFRLTDFMPLGTIIKTWAESHASVHTPAPARRGRHARSERLRQQSQRLRQQSHTLSARVQVLCAKSLQLLRKEAILRVKPRS